MNATCVSHQHPSVAFYRDSETVISLPVNTLSRADLAAATAVLM